MAILEADQLEFATSNQFKVLRLANDFGHTGDTNNTAVTGMSLTIGANEIWSWECHFIVSHATLGTGRFTMNQSSVCTSMTAGYSCVVGGSTLASVGAISTGASFNTVINNVMAAGSTYNILGFGCIQETQGAAQTINFQIRTSNAGGTITALANSWVVARRIS